MNEAHVTLNALISAAESKNASLVPETAGYLVLCIALAAGRVPRLFDENNIFLSLDGDVDLGPRCEVVSPLVGVRLLRALLARLLAVSSGAHAALFAVAHGHSEQEPSIAELASTLETALIPINRSASKRALARLARESLKAESAGMHGHPSSASNSMHSEPTAARSGPMMNAPYVPGFPLHGAHEAFSPLRLPQSSAPLPRPPSPGERRLEGMRSSLSRTLWGAPIHSTQYAEPSIEMRPLRAPVVLTPLPSCVLTPVARAPVEPRPLRPPEIIISRPFDEIEAPREALLEDCEGTPSPKDENLPFWKEASTRAQEAEEEAPAAAKKGCTLRFFAPRSIEGESESEGRLEEVAAMVEGSLITFLDFTPIECGPPIEGTPTLAMGPMSFDVEPEGAADGALEPSEVHLTLPWPAKYPYGDQEGRASVVPALAFEPPLLEFTAPQPTYTADAALPLSASEEPIEALVEDELIEPEELYSELPASLVSESVSNPIENKEVTIELDLKDCELFTQGRGHSVVELASESLAAPSEKPAPALEIPISDTVPEPEPSQAITLPKAPAGPDRADELLRAFVAGKEGETHLRATAKDLRAFAGIELTPSLALVPLRSASARKDELSGPLPTAVGPDDITPPGASGATAIQRPSRPLRAFSGTLARDIFAFAIGLLGATGLLYLRPTLADDVISLVAQALPSPRPPVPGGEKEPPSKALSGPAAPVPAP